MNIFPLFFYFITGMPTHLIQSYIITISGKINEFKSQNFFIIQFSAMSKPGKAYEELLCRNSGRPITIVDELVRLICRPVADCSKTAVVGICSSWVGFSTYDVI